MREDVSTAHEKLALLSKFKTKKQIKNGLDVTVTISSVSHLVKPLEAQGIIWYDTRRKEFRVTWGHGMHEKRSSYRAFADGNTETNYDDEFVVTWRLNTQ